MARKAQKKDYHFKVEPLIKKYPKARYYFLLGARSCGKTYPTIQRAIKDAIDGNGVFVYVRRYKESIADSKLQHLMSPQHEWVSKYTEGRWNRVTLWRHCWYLERWENNANGEYVRAEKNPIPIGIAVAMNTWETDKGADFGADKGGIAHMIFDEVLSAGGNYLKDEWQIFQNVISSYVRDRWEKDTKIWMLANPVSKYGGPYMRNMGIKKAMMETFGTYELTYKDSDAKNPMSAVFVYIAAILNDKGETIDIDENKTNVYNNFFAFPNSKGTSKSITHGYWEMDDANLLPSGVYKDSELNRTIWLAFGEELLAVDIMLYEETEIYYMFVRPTKKIPKGEWFITLDMTLDRYGIVGLKTGHPISELLNKIYRSNQVYYADLESADIFHGFLKEAQKRVA